MSLPIESPATSEPTLIAQEAGSEVPATIEGEIDVTSDPSALATPTRTLQTFASEPFGLSFEYPASWFGPDVVESTNGIRIEVGSDVVYPYGTGLEDRVYEVKDSYYVVIQFRVNNDVQDLEELRQTQPWVEQYFTVMDMADGESQSGPRAKITRIRSLTISGFEGIEYISTLSETAQTERYYVRQAFLFDQELNILRVAGSPNNVEISEPSKWRDSYRDVDQAHEEIFREILNSISLE